MHIDATVCVASRWGTARRALTPRNGGRLSAIGMPARSRVQLCRGTVRRALTLRNGGGLSAIGARAFRGATLSGHGAPCPNAA